MTGFTDRFGGSTLQAAQVAYRAVALTADLELLWPAFADEDTVCARLMDVTPSAGGFSIYLPDATLSGKGQDVFFYNPSAYSFTVKDYDGNTIATVSAGTQRYVYMTSSATAAGVWRSILMGVGSSAVDAAGYAGYGLEAIGATLNQAAASTTISANTTITSADRSKVYVNTGGAISFTLPLSSAATANFFCEVRNQGTGTMTLTPVGGELIDASATLVLQVNESCFIHAGVGAWYTVGRGRNQQFNFTQLVKPTTGGTITLTQTEASNVVQTYTGVLVSNVTLVVPSVVQVYYISNQTTGGFTFTIQSPTPGTTVVLPQGQNAVIFCDGVNVINAATTVTGITSLLLNAGTAAAPALAFVNVNNGLFAPTGASVAVSAGGTEVVRWIGGQELNVAGTAGAPAYAFTASPNLGMYRAAADQLGFAVAGVQNLLMTATLATLATALALPAGAVGAPALYLSTDTTSGLYRIGANNHAYTISGAKVLDIAAAGLGVTGTFSATSTGTFSSTTSLLLGTAGSAVGNVGFRNATSGTATVGPPTGALGTYTVTLPNAASTLPIFGQQITFAGPTAARTVTFPDASFTAARTDAANTFTGTQTFSNLIAAAAGGVGAPSIYLGGDTTSGLYRIAPNNHGYTISGAKVLDISAGSFGVTGIAGITTPAATNSIGLALAGSTTGAQRISWANTGATMTMGVDSAANDVFGNGAYFGAINSSTSFALMIAGTTRGLFSSTGLAVTGVLSATGDLTVTGGNIQIGAASASLITTTVDGTDNARLFVCGGGGVGSSRGATIELAGNEHADTGTMFLDAGNVVGGLISLRTAGVVQLQILRTASANRYITLTGSNGGDPTLGVSAGSLAISSNIVVAGTGPHAIGGATTASTQWSQLGTYAGSRAFGLSTTLTLASGDTAYGMLLNPTFTEFSSGTHAIIAGLYVQPTITNGAATTTDLFGTYLNTFVAGAGTTRAATLYMEAPTAATTNYVLWAASGSVRIDGTGPHSVGATPTTGTQWFQSGTFVGTRGYRMSTTFTLAANESAYGMYLSPVFTEFSSGTHGILSGIFVQPFFTNGAGLTADAIGVYVPSFAAAAGTTRATGLYIDGPTGGTTNRALWVTSGSVSIGGANATGATSGHLSIPTSAGAPTGVPADPATGTVALQFDTTNNRLYVYDGAWLSVALA